MKLLFLNHNVAWSGTFFRAFQLGRALVTQGHEVTVVTTSRTNRFAWEREQREGVELVYAPDLLWGRARTGWDLWNTLSRVLELRKRRFDAIHAFDSRPAVILPALYLARAHRLPLFIDWADWWGRGGAIQERPGRVVNTLISGLETWFEEAFRHHAVGNTVISRALEQRAVDLGLDAATILRFPNGSDAAALRPRERLDARRALGLAPDAKVLVHIGLVYPGDLELLLRSVAELARMMPGVQLVLVGNPKAPVRDELVPPGVLRQTGFVDFDVLQNWLAAADATVIPMRDTVCARGRWPGKVNDYFCAARPVVMPRVGDAADYVESHGAGWVSPPEPRAFAHALAQPILEEGAAAAAGARGRALAEGELSWTTIGQQVDRFYRVMTTAGSAQS